MADQSDVELALVNGSRLLSIRTGPVQPAVRGRTAEFTAVGRTRLH